MRCSDAGKLMDEVLDGRVNSERQAALLAHTADCAACRAEWLAIQEVDRMLAAAPPVPPPADFTSKVMARLPRRRPAQNPWAGALVLFAGAVLLSFFVLLSFVSLRSTPESAGLVGFAGGVLLQLGGSLVQLVRAGGQMRGTVLGFVPPVLIMLYALLSVVAVIIWLRLVVGVQATLQAIDK